MPEAAAPIAFFLLGCAVSACSRWWLATRLARQAYLHHRWIRSWKASCLAGSLWLAMLAGAITSLVAALLKPVLALSAGPDLLVPLLVGIIVAIAIEALKFVDAYWTVVHDSLECGLLSGEKIRSGFNSTHTRLTTGRRKERQTALGELLSIESLVEPSAPAEPRE